jgi:PPOX class probable FMN-dependent enzyme
MAGIWTEETMPIPADRGAPTPAGAVGSVADLEAVYGTPARPSIVKETSRLTPGYRQMIEASPFCTLATTGPDGLDVSPRGDQPGFVSVLDDSTLLLPDRRGNNRIDSLRNVLHDPCVALLFLIPGLNETLRVNGRATISIDADLCGRFNMDGHLPRSVLWISIDSVYFQCARALLRSRLWHGNGNRPEGLPTPGELIAQASNGAYGGPDYDAQLAERLPASLY